MELDGLFNILVFFYFFLNTTVISSTFHLTKSYVWQKWCSLAQTVSDCASPSPAPQLSFFIVLTQRLKVNVIMLVLRSWGEPIRRSQEGLLSRSGAPSEAGSIQNNAGQIRSCLMSKDLWGTNMGHQKGNWDIGSTNYQEGSRQIQLCWICCSVALAEG